MISAAPPGTGPWRQRIHARNELLLRLGAASVLVDAGAPSKRLRAAEHAARGGHLVCAVPGPGDTATWRGCQMLIRAGVVRSVTGAQQVLAAIGSQRGARLLPLDRAPSTRPRRAAQVTERPSRLRSSASGPGGAIEMGADLAA